MINKNETLSISKNRHFMLPFINILYHTAIYRAHLTYGNSLVNWMLYLFYSISVWVQIEQGLSPSLSLLLSPSVSPCLVSPHAQSAARLPWRMRRIIYQGGAGRGSGWGRERGHWRVEKLLKSFILSPSEAVRRLSPAKHTPAEEAERERAHGSANSKPAHLHLTDFLRLCVSLCHLCV